MFKLLLSFELKLNVYDSGSETVVQVPLMVSEREHDGRTKIKNLIFNSYINLLTLINL
jgi:hypothetical protein